MSAAQHHAAPRVRHFDVCSPPTGELSQHGTRHKEEVASLHKSIAALDREKDALQDEVDCKTEKVVALQEENCKKVREAQGPQHRVKPVPSGLVNIFAPADLISRSNLLPFSSVKTSVCILSLKQEQTLTEVRLAITNMENSLT